MDKSEPDRCASCGARNPGATGGGTLHVVATNDLAEVEQIMRGGLDKVTCAACSTPLAVTTTIVLVSPQSRRAAMTVSNLASAELDIAGTVRNEMAGQGIELTPLSSADEVRAWLLDLWTQRLPADVMEALQADADRRSVIIAADPDRFDPEALIGAALIAVYGPAGAPFAIADDTDPAEVVDLIATVQARTLFAVVERWMNDPQRGVEPDFRRHLPAGGLLPGTADKILPPLSALLTQDISSHLRYAAHALLASVCAEAERPNPEAASWAGTWLDLELLLDWEEGQHGTESHGADDAPSAVGRPTRIDADRATRTLTHEALHDAVVQRIGVNIAMNDLEPAIRAAARAGFPNFGRDFTAALWSDPSVALTPEQILAAVHRSVAGRSPGDVLMAVDRIVRTHVRELRPAQVWPMADAMGEWWPDGRARTDIELFAAAALSRLAAPSEFLRRVGDEPRAFEAALPLAGRVALQWARADALCSAGRYREAEAILSSALADAECSADGNEVDLLRPRRTLAIARRHLGRPADAVAKLRELVDTGSVVDQLETMHALVVALLSLGRADEATIVVGKAVALCAGPHREERPRFAVLQASLLTSQGRITEAREALATITIDDLQDPAVVAPFASALVSSPELMKAIDRPLLAAAVDALHRVWDEHGRDWLSEPARQALRLLALLADSVDHRQGYQLWRSLAELSAADGRQPDSLAALALAVHALDQGDLDQAHVELDVAFAAVAAGHTTSEQLSESYLSTRFLWSSAERLQAAGDRDSVPVEHQRVVAELGRDVVGRAAVAHLGDIDIGPPGATDAPWDEVVATLPGPLGVLEWVGRPGARTALLTVVDDGTVRARRLDSWVADLDGLSARLDARLQGWYAGHRSDPFDLPKWAELADWLCGQIATYAGPAATIAVIEHREIPPMPWHVALTPHWPTLRVPSWSALLAERGRPAPPVRRAGCLTVPRYREAAGVVAAFQRFAAAIGATIPTLADNGEQADRTAFDTLLTQCDLLAVACHGYVSPADATIAWLAAADGSLPLLGSVESEREMGARHRYTWRDADRLSRTSPVVISAACRSGTTHYGGATEQLGFYAALRRHGTRTFIAPRWDVPAVETLPVFAKVAAGLSAGIPPAAAVRAASLAAATNQPPWIAFAPSVTGGWW